MMTSHASQEYLVRSFFFVPVLICDVCLSHPRKLKYIFQEMIDTERDYVKSLQYIMDVSKLFLSTGVSLSINVLSSFFQFSSVALVLPFASYLLFLL